MSWSILPVLLLVVLVACDGRSGERPDATIDAHGGGSGGGGTCVRPTPICPLDPATFCNHNDQIDACWQQQTLGCDYHDVFEACDGTAVKTCSEAGYYGGTSSCVDCRPDYTACEVCAVATCTSIPSFAMERGLAVSGSHVALASLQSVAITNGLTLVTIVSIANVSTVVGVPGGWLVATYAPALATLDTAGALGTARALPAGIKPDALAYANGRVLLAWSEQINAQWRVSFAIADTTGNIVVAATQLFTSSGGSVGVTSDGTSFFVAANGQLARVATDGSFTVTAGFVAPQYELVDLSWATTGYYATRDQTSNWYNWQHFDAAGAKLGSAASAQGYPVDFVGDGTNLNTLSFDNGVRIRRHPMAGVTLDGGTAGASPGALYARFDRMGDQLVVAWRVAGRTQLAFMP